MKRALILAILVISIFTVVTPIVQDNHPEISPASIQPVEVFVDSGEQNEVTVRFDRELTSLEIEYYERNGINFGGRRQILGPRPFGPR